MKSPIGFSAIWLMAASTAIPASATVYSDDLGKCLVKATTEADKSLLVKWMFSAFSAGPAVASLSKVTDADRQSYNHAIGKLMDRLVLSDCRQAAIDAVKADGPNAFKLSFELLGGVAARQLMSDPAVNTQMQAIGANIDTKAWTKLMQSAGEVMPPK